MRRTTGSVGGTAVNSLCGSGEGGLVDVGGGWGWFRLPLAGPFVSLMTWLRKVCPSIQKALRVILPDDGHFAHM